MSVTMSNNDKDLSKSLSKISKKRYKRWTQEEEQQLISLIKLKDKSLQELNDNDWSELANRFELGP